MKISTIKKAKANLSDLIRRAEFGEEIIICRAGKPVARLIQDPDCPPRPRRFGLCAGQIHMSPDFDDPWTEDFVPASREKNN